MIDDPPLLTLIWLVVPNKLSVPLKELRAVTPPPPPPAPLRQSPHDKTPDEFVLRHCPEDPSAVGSVNVRFDPVTPLCKVRVLLLVLLYKTILPVALLPTPTLSPPDP